MDFFCKVKTDSNAKGSKVKDSQLDDLEGIKIVDNTHGSIKIIKDPSLNGQIIMSKTITVDSERSVKEFINKTEKRMGLRHKNLTVMLDYSYYVKSEWWSQHYIVNTYYDYYENSVYNELADRMQKQMDFVDEEIAKI